MYTFENLVGIGTVGHYQRPVPGSVYRRHQIAQTEIILILETDQQDRLRATLWIARRYLRWKGWQYSHVYTSALSRTKLFWLARRNISLRRLALFFRRDRSLQVSGDQRVHRIQPGLFSIDAMQRGLELRRRQSAKVGRRRIAYLADSTQCSGRGCLALKHAPGHRRRIADDVRRPRCGITHHMRRPGCGISNHAGRPWKPWVESVWPRGWVTNHTTRRRKPTGTAGLLSYVGF